MTRRRLVCLALSAVLFCGQAAGADEFERLEGDALARVATDAGSKRRDSLRLEEIEGLPTVLKETSAALLVVKTGRGNYTRILATAGLRKSDDGGATSVPVVV